MGLNLFAFCGNFGPNAIDLNGLHGLFGGGGRGTPGYDEPIPVIFPPQYGIAPYVVMPSTDGGGQWGPIGPGGGGNCPIIKFPTNFPAAPAPAKPTNPAPTNPAPTNPAPTNP